MGLIPLVVKSERGHLGFAGDHISIIVYISFIISILTVSLVNLTNRTSPDDISHISVNHVSLT